MPQTSKHRWPSRRRSGPDRRSLTTCGTHERCSLPTLSGRAPFGVEIPQQSTHPETGDNEEHRKIRQQENSVVPQVNRLAWADGQAIDDERCGSGSGSVAIGCWPEFQGCHTDNLPWVFLVTAHNFEIAEVSVLVYDQKKQRLLQNSGDVPYSHLSDQDQRTSPRTADGRPDLIPL